MRPEDALQIEVVRLLRLAGLTFTATANGAFLQGDAKQRAMRGKRMKEMGVSNGVPDILIFNPFLYIEMPEDLPTWCVGLAIELKAGKNKATPDQLQWINDLHNLGWRAKVCNGMDEVLAVLRECYPGRLR